MPRARSERALRREGLYGAPLPGEGWRVPAREAWPEEARLLVGTSGWSYRHWLGRLYPRNLPGPRALAYYAARFPTVEVNSTYYRLPPEATFDAWREGTPPGFRFVVKSPGSITHEHRLEGVTWETQEFVARCQRLGERLGLILFQLPPGFHADVPLLSRFLDALPRGPSYALELRHRSWFERDVRDLLHAHRVAFVVHDYGTKGSPLWTTAEDAYLRLHGPTGRYRGAYDRETLLQWSEQLKDWLASGHRCWVFFNNDERGKSAQNALDLVDILQAGRPSAAGGGSPARGADRSQAERRSTRLRGVG